MKNFIITVVIIQYIIKSNFINLNNFIMKIMKKFTNYNYFIAYLKNYNSHPNI